MARTLCSLAPLSTRHPPPVEAGSPLSQLGLREATPPPWSGRLCPLSGKASSPAGSLLPTASCPQKSF